MAVMTLRDIRMAFSGPPVLDGVNLTIEKGERICLMGRNGTGKTTLIRIMNGDIEPDSGEVMREKGLRSAFLTQDVPDLLPGTAGDVVRSGAYLDDADISVEEWEIRNRMADLCRSLGVDPAAPFGTLSAGLKRRTLLARALMADPDLLLLDEPTNHLDIPSIQWLEQYMSRYTKTLVFVTHDRMFLRNLATRVIELDRGEIYNWNCDYDTFVQRKDATLDTEIRQRDAFEKKLASEEAWIRRGVKARRTRNEGRVKALMRMRELRNSWRDKTGMVRMHLQEAERTGKLVLAAESVSHGYDGADLIENFNLYITRGDKIGILGPNGCGKTTLLKILLRELAPQHGSVRHGTRLETVYFDQLREQLDEEKSVQDNVQNGSEIITVNGKKTFVISYLQDFLFSPDRIRSPVSVLSGGERNRLLLAKLFVKPSNVLILDEPTNDLDLETLELLEARLVAYSGTVLVVSHDRMFLNNVATSVLVFEGSGKIQEYAGGYDDWLVQRRETDPAERTRQPRKGKPPKPKPAAPKLTYRQQQELDGLPGRIEAMEAEQMQAYETLSDPMIYQREPDTAARLQKRLKTLASDLESAYARWEELETIRGAGEAAADTIT